MSTDEGRIAFLSLKSQGVCAGLQAMLVFDVDSDQNLNRAEFARFVNAFCEGCETDFNTLSEFLILLAAMEDSPSEELAFMVSTFIRPVVLLHF